MSLYYEAAAYLSPSDEQGASLKSRVYSAKGLKSKPSQLYALVTEASKWSSILKEVVEKSQLLSHERKVVALNYPCLERY
jgi:putative methyltransferase